VPDPPPLAVAPPAPPPKPAAETPASAPVVQAPPVTPFARPILPDEPDMTDADRRRVQQALAAIGYYVGAPDGQFGPNTRAAIRRFQFEIGAAMTGTLSAAQASRLVAGR